MTPFLSKLEDLISKNNSLVCVGLDSDIQKIPRQFLHTQYPLVEFNKAIIEATFDLVCAYKPNPAFYETLGESGFKQLKLTIEYLHQTYPEIPVIVDAKRADIGNTNEMLATYVYDYLGADAVTLHPYLGRETLEPFLVRADKGCIILCRTSNPGAGEFQDLEYEGKKLYQIVAQKVVNEWNYNHNCMLVVGATYPHEVAEVRKAVGDMTLLVPGVGAQGGDVETTIKAGLNNQHKGLVINSGRGIIFASSGIDFAQKAREATIDLRDQINKYRN